MRRLLIALAILGGLAGAAWLTVSVTTSDGSVWAWGARTGELRVPSAGIAWLPRWSWTRIAPGRLTAQVAGSSAEGVRVDADIAVTVPIGRLTLKPAATPDAGLAAVCTEVVRSALAPLPLGCLTGAPPATGCAVVPQAAVRDAIAGALGIAPGQVAVTLRPDAEATRRFLLSQMQSRLPATSGKVLVIGLDAVDWDLVLPFVRQGLMPNLKRLLAEGTWGEMNTIVPMLSPLIWTTMATGVGPDEHGILDFVEKDPATGQMLPVTGRQRRVPAIWNVASALGKSVDVVGWWATWPAERIDGTMVSDRLYFTLTQGISKDALRGDPPGLVFPDTETSRFTGLRDRTVKSTDWSVVHRYLAIPEDAYESALREDRGWEDPIDGTRRIIAATDTYFASALDLAAKRPDLLMVYIEGTDEIGHVLAPYMPPPLVDVDPSTAATYAAAVPRYFSLVDEWIGKLLDACPLSQYTVVILSDHGFKWGADRPKGLSGTSGPTAPLWHDDHAMFLLAGRGVTGRGRAAVRGSVYDVAPTVATLLGIPPDTSWRPDLLPGAPGHELPPVDYRPLVPPASYRTEQGVAAPVDPEYIAKLQSLGYLSGSGSPTPGPAAATPAPTAAPAADLPSGAPEMGVAEPGGGGAGDTADGAGTTTRGQLNNLAVIKINEKKYDEAEKLLRQAIAMSPEYAAPHYNLRRLYMETGRYGDADRELWLAVDKGLRDPERSVDRAAADYESLGLEDRAEGLLREATKRFPDHEPFWVHILVVELRLDRCQQGLEYGRIAAKRFPDSAPVHAFYGLSAACAGQAGEARTAIERSLALNPNQPALQRALTDLGER